MDNFTVHKLLNNHWVVEQTGEKSVFTGKTLFQIYGQYKPGSTAYMSAAIEWMFGGGGDLHLCFVRKLLG